MLDGWVCEMLGTAPPLTRAALDAWQLARLNAIVDYARSHSRFYRTHLPDGDITSFADFAALPFTTPDDLRAHSGQMLCVPPDDIDRVVTLTTSGSTGQPKRIWSTGADQALTVDYFRHGMSEFVSPGDRVMSLLPGGSPGSLNDLLRQGLEGMGAQLIRFGYPAPGQHTHLLDAILSEGVTSLVGPASAVAEAARLSAAQGRAFALAAQLRSVLLSAEYVSDADRTEIRRTWNCRIDEQYSMTETGFTGPISCCVPGGYHVWEAGLYYEVIDPISGRCVPDGEGGELVVTTLLRQGIPMIRYRTGDRSRFLTGACACGSVLRRLERVQSRIQKKKFVTNPLPNRL